MQRITPVDIQHREFKRALQGYDPADVDQFLDEIIETLEDEAHQRAALEAEISDLRERISHFKAMEESLQNTLVLAQRTADEVKASAHKEADLIREHARLAAEREVASYNDAIADVRREHQAAYEAAERAKGELRHLLSTHLALLDKASLERPREAAPATVAAVVPAAPPDVEPAHEESARKTKNGHSSRAAKEEQPPTEDTTHIVVQ
jgi:cell division initiation protein